MTLFIRPPGPGDERNCHPEQVTWLDRLLLSSGQDRTLHRAPRCPGLRMVDGQWELFSRDRTHRVYLAQGAAQHVLPVASAWYEPLPIPLGAGTWLVSIGEWVLSLRVETTPDAREPARCDDQLPTDHFDLSADLPAGRPARPPRPDAAARAEAFFTHNDKARMAMAYYYQEFILGAAAPQEVPMPIVAAALNLTGQGAVSDYKRKLQDCIWNEQGHQRELGEFLLINNLVNQAHVDQAQRVALKNEQNGQLDAARKRLKYRPKNRAASRDVRPGAGP